MVKNFNEIGSRIANDRMSKIIQLLIRELGFTLSLVERQLNDNNDITIVTIYPL